MNIVSMLDFCINKLNTINQIIEKSCEFPNELMGPHTYYRGYIRRLQRGETYIKYGTGYCLMQTNQASITGPQISGWEY